MIFIIRFSHPEHWLSSQTSSLFFFFFFFFLDPLKNFQLFFFFFSCNRVLFTDCKFLVSLAILKTFCLCIIYLLILSLFPRSFILGQTQFILQCLFKKTFHILAKKRAFAKWNSCMESFQNHVFQSEVQPKNYPGSHISCHAFQSRWQAAESTVCQNPHFHFTQSTSLQGRSCNSPSHLEMAPAALPVSWLNSSSCCFESLLKGNICFSMGLVQFPLRLWGFFFSVSYEMLAVSASMFLAASHISAFKYKYICILCSFEGALEIDLLRLRSSVWY